MQRCEICSSDSSEAGKLQKLYFKAYENLTELCRHIGDSSLLEKWTSKINITVHQRCRALSTKTQLDDEQEHAPRLSGKNYCHCKYEG